LFVDLAKIFFELKVGSEEIEAMKKLLCSKSTETSVLIDDLSLIFK
jgi:hypothetical protein